MTKWKCEGCKKPNFMQCSDPCYVELLSDTYIPRNCILDDVREPQWERVPDEPEQKTENTLPDWCKVGEWVWLDPQKITGANGYEKVTNVDGLGLMFESGLMVCFSHRILQARLRPWTKEEAIGKVVKNACCVGIITYADNFKCIVGTKVITLKELSEEYHEPDGAPCGVLEHLNEKGEWEA